MAEYIEREAALKAIAEDKIEMTPELIAIGRAIGTYTAEQAFDGINQACDRHIESIKILPAADVVSVPEGGIGELSDGYHTFNGLYYQRMVLFAALVKQNKDKAWKSLRHEDGELCFGGGWFIVGIDTPDGSYTYHYEDNFWSMFDCEELTVAPHWDGHTEKDVIRLLSLPDVQPVKHGRWIDGDCRCVTAVCSNCNRLRLGNGAKSAMRLALYCERCGARMDGET